tara:strand:+ start:17123 stop:19423 length:2301 start_codon:yes stop_codon:yes gene_type:complete
MSLDLLIQFQGWLFAAVLVALVALEWLSPLRRRPDKIFPRWLTNIGLYLVSGYCLFLILPAGLLTVTLDQPSRGLVATGLSPWLTIPATAIIIDAWRYWQHRWYHEIPLLWRAHLVHHSDTRVDITTTERHHPLEAVMSLTAALALAMLLGLPTEGIATYYIVAMAIGLVSHANIDLPPAFDRALRKVIVTPAVHAIHHSDLPAETDSNYGAVLTVWDRLFNTYTRPSEDRDIRFGLEYFRGASSERFWRTLWQPFIYKPQQAYRKRASGEYTAARIPALLAACAAGFVIVTLALWPITASMLSMWAEREPWQYAFLVPPVFVYLVGWEYRDELLRESSAPGWSGLLLAIPACGVVLAGEILVVNIGKQIGLVLFYQAIILSALGSRVYLKYLPVWALLFLLVPYEDVVMPILRAGTLWSIEAASAVANLPFTANGYAVEVSGNHYVIVPACAGMTFFTLAIFLGYSFGLIAFRRFLPLLGFTLLCGAAAVVANLLRVNAIIAADLWRGTQVELASHSPYRWVAFTLMLALIILLVSKLQPNRPAARAKTPDRIVTAARWWAPAATASLSMFVALGASSLNNTVSRDLIGIPPISVPEQLGLLRAQSPAGPWRERAGRDTAYSSTLYANGASQQSVLIEMALSSGAKLDPAHIEPDENREWKRTRYDIRDACYHSRCISYLHNIWKLRGTEEIYNVYSSYAIDDTLTASKLALRLHRGLNRLSGAADRAVIVTIVSDDPIADPTQVAEHLIRVKDGLEPAELIVAR